tara:strand:+ start:513 stop:710 length:198 start_codon:yes stop_codon:yes gene_type:complete
MRYDFLLRKSEEKIWSCVASNTKSAWSYFSQRKRLNVKALKNLYKIKNLEYVKRTNDTGRFIYDQ